MRKQNALCSEPVMDDDDGWWLVAERTREVGTHLVPMLEGLHEGGIAFLLFRFQCSVHTNVNYTSSQSSPVKMSGGRGREKRKRGKRKCTWITPKLKMKGNG